MYLCTHVLKKVWSKVKHEKIAAKSNEDSKRCIFDFIALEISGSLGLLSTTSA